MARRNQTCVGCGSPTCPGVGDASKCPDARLAQVFSDPNSTETERREASQDAIERTEAERGETR